MADGRAAIIPALFLAQSSDALYPGGAMFNTAIALGRLGEETGFLSGVSSDMFGQQLIAYLEESGVSTAYCAGTPNPTPLAFVRLQDGIAKYSFMDENSAGRMLSVDALSTFPETLQALHFGAISLIAEPCGSTFEELILRMNQTKVISLDPNIRPGFVSDEPACRERLRRMIAMSDIIKVSEEDLAWMEPGERFEHIAQKWIEGGASVVTLTLGAEGTRSITRRADITVPATPVAVVDTVGTGDTFNAGLLASLHASGVLSKKALAKLDQSTLRSAIEYGSRVAAYTVSQAGANPPWRHDLVGAVSARDTAIS